jgi:hypothetical protein
MDGRRFDQLIRTLENGSSRRKLVTLLGGGALAAVFGRFGVEVTEAACVKAGKKCGNGKKCCSGAACKGGTCKCKSGQPPCGVACGKAGETCANGQCQQPITCPPGQTDRDGVCRDLKTDEANCGACGNACKAEEECIGGGSCACRFPHVECGDACCPLGQVCFKGKCTVDQGSCLNGSNACAQGQVNCNASDCLCLERFEGGTRCVDMENAVPGCASCSTDFFCQQSADAGPGFVCVRGGPFCRDCDDSRFGFCAPLCPKQVGG